MKEKELPQVNVLSPCMPLYGTLSLFRTSFAGCYAFPCVSLGCDVSTCKPYELGESFVGQVDWNTEPVRFFFLWTICFFSARPRRFGEKKVTRNIEKKAHGLILGPGHTELESGDSNSNDDRFHSNPHEFSHQTS